MKEHDCLGKSCRYFERDEKCPYWKHLELQKQAEEKRKAQIQKEKQQKAMDSEHLRVLTESWQEYLDDMDSDMYIVRVAKETPSLYKIFYVSDNRFADGNRYPNFLDTLKFVYPHYRIQLRHIRIPQQAQKIGQNRNTGKNCDNQAWEHECEFAIMCCYERVDFDDVSYTLC